MKYIYALLLLITFSSQAQKGIVKYGFIDATGVGNAKGLDLNSYLIFEKDDSYYVSNMDSLEVDANKKRAKNSDDDDDIKTIDLGNSTSVLGNQVAYNKKEKKVYSSLQLDKVLFIKETAYNFNWKIEKEKKKIGKFNCTKATASFRGRNYIAWFTLEVPVSFGPWKLNGLPGLILEAYDTNKEVYWYFKSIEYPTKSKQKVNFINKLKSDKSFKWITLNEQIKYCKNILEKSYEKMILISKKIPNIKPVKGTMKQSYIEVTE